MAVYDRIFADIRKDIPSVVDAVLRQELFRVMDDFTQTTNIWQEHVLVSVGPNVANYHFQTATGKPNRLLTIYLAVPIVDPLIVPDMPVTEFPPAPTFWPGGLAAMRVPGILQIKQMPSQAQDWRVVVAKRTAEPLDVNSYPVIDEWIVDKYADTIGRGVISRLQWEPQKPYSNPMLAMANQRAYVAGRSLARANDSHANLLDGQNWMFPQGWGVTNRRGFA